MVTDGIRATARIRGTYTQRPGNFRPPPGPARGILMQALHPLRHPMPFVRTTLAVCIGLVGALAHAETDALSSLKQMSLDELADIRVSIASQRSERVEDTAAAVTVLTAEDIRRSGATTIPELLRTVPGLNVARIAADQIGTADMAIEIDAYTGPIKARGYLFDMRRFSRAMKSLHDDTAIMGKARKNGARRLRLKMIIGVDLGNMFISAGKAHYREGCFDGKYFFRGYGLLSRPIYRSIEIRRFF